MDKRTNEQMAKDLATVTKRVQEMSEEEAEELKKNLGPTEKVFVDKVRVDKRTS